MNPDHDSKDIEALTATEKERSASCSSSSLLDILIKTEESVDEPDPLDQFENIGEAVIGQLLGTSNTSDEILQNALKMFDDAMAYTVSPSNTRKRKCNRRESQKSVANSPPSSTTSTTAPIQTESCAKRFHKSDLRAGFSPRTKFDVDCSEFFQNGQEADTQFEILHKKLEKERTELFDNQVNRDVDRLLQSANRIYGPKQWTPEEKTEFSLYCRNLRSGTLSDEDKINLHNFYTKAYEQESQTFLKPDIAADQNTVKDILASQSALSFPIQADPNITKFEKAEKLEDVKQEQEVGECSASSGLLKNLEAIPFAAFHPGMKYEKEKEFRSAANTIFMNVYHTPRNHRGYSKSNSASLNFPVQTRYFFEKEDLESLVMSINNMMNEENKVWTQEELKHLSRFYNMFREKMHLTIVQTKEFGNFLRKAFGRLEQYEIERENDAALQEKRKYWQEYKKRNEPVKKERRASNSRVTPVRPYIKSNINTKGETEEERRHRKAAYLRQWRLAQKEKQLYSAMFGTLPTPHGEN